MSKPLITVKASECFELLKPSLRDSLVAFNELRFADGQLEIGNLQKTLEMKKIVEDCTDELFLNDMFVLSCYMDMFSEYGDLWEKICNQHFVDSWNSLQNVLDLLRLIKKFSEINIQFFENQLIELERTYPYKVFFSMGAIVESFECGICGKDIDSAECMHMRGSLYGGKMAYAKARNIFQLDHVAIVKYPEDKRCVVSYDDKGEEFKLVRFISSLLVTRKLRLSDFGLLHFSKKIISNPVCQKVGRNDLCFCGSGRKFKKCCINEAHVQSDHVDIVANPANIELAIP